MYEAKIIRIGIAYVSDDNCSGPDHLRYLVSQGQGTDLIFLCLPEVAQLPAVAINRANIREIVNPLR